MFPASLTRDETDAIRKEVNGTLEPSTKSALGQFMTPSALAEFMASLFDSARRPVRLLDAGAGIGSLTLAAVKRLGAIEDVEAWEIDPLMRIHLERNLKSLAGTYSVHNTDFIEAAVRCIASGKVKRYTHAILNPPYKKLNSGSTHRALLRKVGIETVNLYTAFVALSVLLMQEGGQVVAIIPRSFCNGPYYKPFRDLVLGSCALEHIHVFEARNKAFKDDDVLQENVIIKLVKGKRQGDVTVSTSHDHYLGNYIEKKIAFQQIVKVNDPDTFIHVPTGEHEVDPVTALFEKPLKDIGFDVSTGPVVDFRMKEYWLAEPTIESIPLLYPHHFSTGSLQYPRKHKKPNALRNCDEVRKWLFPNECYVIVKRFSSKEEKRRVVAYVVNPGDIKCDKVGFENHWNIIHRRKRGIDPVLARGLACFLNSTALDKHFRVFSGHTQVNATDLRNIKYPSLNFLEHLGKRYRLEMTQMETDEVIKMVHEQGN